MLKYCQIAHIPHKYHAKFEPQSIPIRLHHIRIGVTHRILIDAPVIFNGNNVPSHKEINKVNSFEISLSINIMCQLTTETTNYFVGLLNSNSFEQYNIDQVCFLAND